MKAVVDHADGTRETFVTDGTWKVSKAAEFTTATVTTRNGDAGDKAERYDARNEQPGWDKTGFDDSAWQPAYAIGPHPRPLNPMRETYSHLDPAISQLEYETIHPKSITKLADGSIVADFGKVSSSVPQLELHNGVAGRALVMQTSYRLNNTTLSAAVAAGATTITVASAAELRRRRQDHRRPGRQRLRQGRPRDPHDHRDRRHDVHARRTAEQAPTRPRASSRARAPARAPTTPRAPTSAGGTPRRTAPRPRARTCTGAGATCRSSRPARGRSSAPTTSPPSSSTSPRPLTARRPSTPTTRRSTRSSS